MMLVLRLRNQGSLFPPTFPLFLLTLLTLRHLCDVIAGGCFRGWTGFCFALLH
jgi:hypothetical protein